MPSDFLPLALPKGSTGSSWAGFSCLYPYFHFATEETRRQTGIGPRLELWLDLGWWCRVVALGWASRPHLSLTSTVERGVGVLQAEGAPGVRGRANGQLLAAPSAPAIRVTPQCWTLDSGCARVSPGSPVTNLFHCLLTWAINCFWRSMPPFPPGIPRGSRVLMA